MTTNCEQGTVSRNEDMMVKRANSVLKGQYRDQLKKVEPG